MISRPLARSQDLIVEELDGELLVYDERTDRGHCLSPEAARVWRRCDGRTPADRLSAQLDLDPDTVQRALDELEGCDLLEASPELAVDGATAGSTRRELTVRMAKVGGAVAAAPMIVSIMAPTAEAALTIPPGCELAGAPFPCSADCGAGDPSLGCKVTQKNVPGCVCCQLNQCDCTGGTPCCCNGHLVQRTSNIKKCILGTDINCPVKTDPCQCTTPCPGNPPCTAAAVKKGQVGTTDQYTAPGTSTAPTGTTTTTTTPTPPPSTTTPTAPPSTGTTTTP